MARSNRQRILEGGTLRSTINQSPSFNWSRLVGKRTVGHDEMSDSSHTRDRKSSNSKSGMHGNESKKKGPGGIDGRNAGPSTEVQRRAGMQAPDISSLPTRLRPHGENIQQLVELLSALNPALSDFLTSCSEHASEVESMETVLADNKRLQADNDEHMNLINSLNQSLGVAYHANDGRQRDLDAAKTQVEDEKNSLIRDRESVHQRDVERREEQARELAAMKDQLLHEHEALKAKLKVKSEEEESSRGQQADKEKREAKEEFERQRKKLESQAARSQRHAESVQNKLEELKQENDRLNKRSRDLNNLKEFLNTKNSELQDEVDGFASQSRPISEYVTAFRQIELRIHGLASEYLQDFQVLPQKNLEMINKKLSANDRLFAVVPISDSKESSQLCRAHIERVVTENIFQTIWKPFSCDRLVEDCGLSSLLLDVHERVIVGSHRGSRQEIFWITQTCRALLAIRSSGHAGERTDNSVPSDSSNRTRAGRTYAAIESVVRPLIAKERQENFQTSLKKILADCVDLWDMAMVDKMWFEAESSLGLDWYSRCRSKEFDPADESGQGSVQADARPSHDNVLMLFPRIRAWQPDFEGRKDIVHKAPGSFPDDDVGGHPAQECRDTRKVEVVHSGCALATTSELVVLGEKEVNEQPAVLEQVRNEAVEFYRDKKHRRQSSTMSSSTLVASIAGESESVVRE